MPRNTIKKVFYYDCLPEADSKNQELDKLIATYEQCLDGMSGKGGLPGAESQSVDKSE